MSNLDILLALGKRRKVHTFTYGDLSLQFRGLSNAERLEWREFALIDSNIGKTDAYMIAMALCNADGSPTYADEAGRLEAVAAIIDFDPVEVTVPLIKQIEVASGMGKAAEEAIPKN